MSMPEDMAGHMSENMPGRMPEDMPERMAKGDMAFRLPEDMPDRPTRSGACHIIGSLPDCVAQPDGVAAEHRVWTSDSWQIWGISAAMKYT